MEWLDRGTYKLDPVHPTLSRIAIALPLYLAGERYPNLPKDDPHSSNYNVVGNAIFYGDGHYLRNLTLARIAILPFFVFAAIIVFLWTRNTFGEVAALAATGLFTTIPTILAFSGLAYTDIVAASTQLAALYAFTLWLKKSTLRSTLWLGIACGFAFLAKFTALIFLPACALAIWFGKWFVCRRSAGPKSTPGTKEATPRVRRTSQLLLAALISLFIVLGGYNFSFGHVQEDMQLSPAAMPSFQHFPPVVGNIARSMILKDAVVPVPALIRGLAKLWTLNGSPHDAYLLGHSKNAGWWYFFLVGIAVKTPLPVLLLALVGCWAALQMARDGHWEALAPVFAVAAVLIVTMPVKYDAGVRHVMVVFPLLSIIAGVGCAHLWRPVGGRMPDRRRLGLALLIALIAWQIVSTARASRDFISYFNELAGSDPRQVLIAGCDLDCGQDVYRLASELRERHIENVHLALWSSADMSQSGLPQFDILQPFQPVSGWVATSTRAKRLGSVFHSSYPPDALNWLDPYKPVARVGQTIQLYYIPDGQQSPQ